MNRMICAKKPLAETIAQQKTQDYGSKWVEINKNGPILTILKDNGETATYNFKDKTFLKEQTGNYIKHKQTFFRNYTIDEIKTNDNNLERLFKLLKEQNPYIRNIGSFIDEIFKHPNLEKWVNSEYPFTMEDSYSQYTHYKKFLIKNEPAFFPKEVLRFLKEIDIPMKESIEEKFIEEYQKTWNEYGLLINILKKTRNKKLVRKLATPTMESERFKYLIIDYGYNHQRLLEYLAYLMDYEGYSQYSALSDLTDYARMSSRIHNGGRFKKYPKMLLSIHQIVSENYDVFKETHDEELFKNSIDLYKRLEWSNKEFIIIVPENHHDLVKEGSNLHHCVGSYYNRIVEGRSKILFVRRRKEPNESYMTLDILGNRLMHAEKKYRGKPSKKDVAFLKSFCRKKKLEFDVERI